MCREYCCLSLLVINDYPPIDLEGTKIVFAVALVLEKRL